MTKCLTDLSRCPIPMSLAIPAAVAAGAASSLGRSLPITVSSRTVIKVGFLMVVVGNAIWMTPHGFVPTGSQAGRRALELPSEWNFLALMPAKNSAAFTLVFVTVVNYVIYNRAIGQGTIVWGKIDFASQFVLIFLAFSMIWTMGLMGVDPVAAAKILPYVQSAAGLHRRILHADAGLFGLVDHGRLPSVFYAGRQLCHSCDAAGIRGEGPCAGRQVRSRPGRNRRRDESQALGRTRSGMGNVIKKLVIGLIVGGDPLRCRPRRWSFRWSFRSCFSPMPCWAPLSSYLLDAPSLKALSGAKAVDRPARLLRHPLRGVYGRRVDLAAIRS